MIYFFIFENNPIIYFYVYNSIILDIIEMSIYSLRRYRTHGNMKIYRDVDGNLILWL